ncbi:MAG: DUF2179 domain-containing protein [Bacteroidetes bacterium]|nr:MAG: DUF2179 domain-containing protein [Bacteroidota bacterium]REJ99875.1 MAG: DUF2179 domain-containing protein [Bacteroidota bacterium]REK34248.1 MAG: DUF2179 domain-containing protein [Bacteroidota bacterium]REK50578.1 MAG: DUF2179 domain-containing protein [Bacteroidota bacterium]
MEASFIESDFFRWVVLPVLIFFARMADVTLATLRNVFLSKGFGKIVPFIGFFEVLIWLISIRQIMQHLDNPLCYIGFAAGFAGGTFVGLKIERRLALGLQVLRIITPQHSKKLIEALQEQDIGVTVIDGEGTKGPVKIIFSIIKRKDIEMIRKLIEHYNPTAFYSIEDIRIASQGVFPRKNEIKGAMNLIRKVIPDPKEK